MKFVFVVNKFAGKENSEKAVLDQLTNAKFDYEIYYTKAPKDATDFVKEYSEKYQDEVCFVACGGDGTLNEVVNGAYGHDNAYVSVFPCGSGNDYVKYFGGAKVFENVEDIVNGKKIKVDVMEVQNHYSVNVVNFGLDCVVLNTMEAVRGFLHGTAAYTAGVVKALFVGRHNQAEIRVDDELINPDGQYCLCTIANGSYVGGSYNCAPHSIINDGLMEVCEVKPISMLQFITMSSDYKNGRHLDKAALQPFLNYRQAKKVEVTSKEIMDISVDGEVLKNTHFIIENHQNALNFIQPKNAIEK